MDPNGLAFYGPDGVHSIYDDPYVATDMNNKNENPTGPNGTVETPKVPETSALPNDISTSNNWSGDGNLNGISTSDEINLYPLNDNVDEKLLKDVYRDLNVLKKIIDTLNKNLQNNQNVDESIVYAAEKFLGLNLSDKEDYNEFKKDIGIINSILKDINQSNIQKGSHKEYKMFVNRNDKNHIITVTDYAKCDKTQDVSLFHEVTHFEDSLGTIDNYQYTNTVPKNVSKQERLNTAQCWTLFYKSAYRR